MAADAVAGVAPGNDFTVARLSRELPNRSSVGGLYVERQGDGSLTDASLDDSNRTYALDGRWGIGANGLISGFIAQTDTPGIDDDDHAYRVAANYDSQAWSASADYTEVGEGFNPEVGFLRRDSYRKIRGALLRRYRPADLWGLQELRPHVSYTGFWDFDGFQESGFLHLDNHWEFKSAREFHTGVNFTREGLKEPFEIVDDVVVQPGTYDHSEVQLLYFTDQSAPLSFQVRVTAGGFFGGDRVAIRPTLRYRIGEAFTSEFTWSRNNIDLPVPNGDFDTNLGQLRLSYAFSTKSTLQTLVQYNDRDDVLAANLRFSWLRRANSGLYVVYNEIDDRSDFAFTSNDRSLTIKYSHIFDLL
jgi:hypothetical protein